MEYDKTGIRDAIAIAGGQGELARRLTDLMNRRVSQQMVHYWAHKSRYLPLEYLKPIEEITGVRREKLLPEIFD